MAAGYAVHLANPATIQKYSGLKHVDDKHDAFWILCKALLGHTIFCCMLEFGETHFPKEALDAAPIEQPLPATIHCEMA